MPRGRPIRTKCPKCKRGQYREPRPERGVALIGHEVTMRYGKKNGSGSGGATFYGHRGIMECLDCGHIWASTLEGVRAYMKPSWLARYSE